METHRFDVLSFIFGALFLALTASIVWDVNFDWGFDISDWIFPIGILVVGIALLVSGIRAATKKKDTTAL